jgi:signal transduction histidine kinase
VERVLIIDDDARNRDIARAMLAEVGYEFDEAASGEEGLRLVAERRPDLVLCDVVMPGMEGYEVVRRLKEHAGEEFLPVVLVTALSDYESRMKGLASGADDFLTKPVDPHELQMRVHNLMRLRATTRQLVKRSVEHSELLRFRDEMSSMIVHDLKGPLSVIISNVEFALRDTGLSADTREALDDVLAAGRRAVALIGNLLDVAAMEAGRFKANRQVQPLSPLLRAILRQRAGVARRRGIALECVVDDGVAVSVDRDLLERALENVLDNALRYVPQGGKVRVSAATEAGRLVLRVGNTGPAVPASARHLVFEKFGQAAPGVGRKNLGLGLYFLRLVAEAHGGAAWIEETPDFPAVFCFAIA